jgi:hypothetical protein
MNKARYSFVFLVLLSVISSTLAVVISVQQIANSNHKWCQIVSSLTAMPVPKPSDPTANPSRERSWEIYVQFVELKRSLGC